MRRRALPLLFLVACASAEGAGEHLDVSQASFTSAQATLLDFEFDGQLNSDTNSAGAVRSLVEAQLLFTIGQLNGERSVGRLGELELSSIKARLIPAPAVPAPAPPDAGAPAPAPPPDAGAPAPPPDAGAPAPPPDAGAPAQPDAGAPAPAQPPPPPRYAVTYHARMPVAWAGKTKPTSYSFTLPAKLSQAEQQAFATKYGATCVDPSAGTVSASHMFVAYRPQLPRCTPSTSDIVTLKAKVTESKENTRGKYPEYHRLWADGALRIVMMFSREHSVARDDDEGVWAYDDFLYRSQTYLRELQPDAGKRTDPPGYSSSGATTAKLSAELTDGRMLTIDVALVSSSLDKEGSTFDAWYDGLTPTADVVVYNGHAGLGANVQTLMGKGTFQPGQYLIWFANGCDTFAYVDRTLVDRRARVNPDDPDGTKYMDTVTNVMAGYFHSLEATSMTFIRALLDVREPALAPKTYEQIFAEVDPYQIVVVSGEEDNELEPLPAPPPLPARAASPAEQRPPPAARRSESESPSAPPTAAAEPAPQESGGVSRSGCSIGIASAQAGSGTAALAFGLLALRRVRRLRSRRRAS